MSRLSLILLVVLTGVLVADARIRKPAGEEAKVLAVRTLGGSGHEWLVGGGFTNDGITVVGNVIGPKFDMPNVAVIGSDSAPPKDVERIAEMDKGKPKLDKNNQPVFEKPSWRHPGVTAFIVRLSEDAKTIKSASRLPWLAGAATSACLLPSGEILIAGQANEAMSKVGLEAEAITVRARRDKEGGACSQAFLLKLNADGTQPIWLKTVAGPCSAPSVSVIDGKILFSAFDVMTFDFDGKAVNHQTIPGGKTPTSSINTSGEIAIGGEHHWSTGREPWRCPTLRVYGNDGNKKHHFYDWGGPYVGLDNCRQVSDSALRFVTHDRDGGILFYAWSDGGNSVMTTEPFDVRKSVTPKGLGMTAAGAGVLSCAYIIKLDPLDYRVRNWTFWSATASNNKPNSIWIQTMTRLPGGALAVAGHGAAQIWQTPGRLPNSSDSGQYLSIFSNDLTSLIYSSVLDGTGLTEVTDGAGGRSSQWAINASGRKTLLLGSAGEGCGLPFGGGWCDGYLMVLDVPDSAAAPAELPPEKSIDFATAIQGKEYAKPSAVKPKDGTQFTFSPTVPKFATVDAEFRERHGIWPNFLWGKPVSGSLTVRGDAIEGRIEVACTNLCQPEDAPHMHPLGELLKDPKLPPKVLLVIESIGPPKTHEIRTVEKGKEKIRTVEYREAKGKLTVGDTTIAVAPKVIVGFNASKTGAVESMKLSFFLSAKYSELKLSGRPPDNVIDIRISARGEAAKSNP